MSASPAGFTPGRTPNGGPPQVMRRPKQADPMVRPKDKTKRKPQRPPPANGINFTHTNGQNAPGQGKTQVMPQHSGRPPLAPSSRASPAVTSGPENGRSGFTSPAVAPYTDYPLVTTKRALIEGMRHHVAKFASKKKIDPRDENEFTRPVRLHRRDTRAPPAGAGGAKDESGVGGSGLEDDKERERQDILRAEKDAQREAEAALVAPSTKSGGRKRNTFQKKTKQVFTNNQTDEQKARSKLRYEEALPWHLEDFENKSTWVGSYEAALSDTYAMLVHGQDGKFRMVPVEKWYKFTPKNHFKPMTIEEAETQMGKKVKEPRWYVESQKDKFDKQEEQMNRRATKKLFVAKYEGGANGGAAAPSTKNEHADTDDLDFDEDRFADDEEAPVIEGDDHETKQAEDRIKRDQLQANIFDLKEEKEYDKAEVLEQKEREAEKKHGKKVKKALIKQEKNYVYDSDSSDNPYSEKSEEDDSETERLKAEEVKKEEEKKTASDKEKVKTKPSSSQSGASSKGTNTPSGRASKQTDRTKKGLSSSANALKRPGSPNLSEISGTESTRKKHKKRHDSPSQPTGTSTPLYPPSRPMSPAVPPITSGSGTRVSEPNVRKSSVVRLSVESGKLTDIPSSAPRSDRKRPRGGAGGSGSEKEGVGSGGDMSDGSRKKRTSLKLSMPASKNGSPQGSRGGSPEVKGGDVGIGKKASGDKAGSPDVTSGDLGGEKKENASKAEGPAVDDPSLPFPTAADIIAVIPPKGITVGQFLAIFRPQVVGEERTTKFRNLMKQNSKYNKATRLLTPKDD